MGRNLSSNGMSFDLVTPGTITEERLLDPSEANYLMTLGRVKGSDQGQFALAWIDISTGTFRVSETDPSPACSPTFCVSIRAN